MAKRGKKYIKAKKKQPKEAKSLADAIKKAKDLSYSSFNGSVEIHVALKLPKDTDPKSLKGFVTLPHSISTQEEKIAVFANPEDSKKAAAAGADFTDFDKLVQNVKAGNVEFDIAISTPEMMSEIAVLGKALGPRGLMPSPKTGTLTDDVVKAVEEFKAGKLNFASDASGVMHFAIGKLDTADDKIIENAKAVIKASSEVIKKKPEQAVRIVHLAPSMGPSVEVELDFETL